MTFPPDTPHYKRPYESPSTPAHFCRVPPRTYPVPPGRTITNPRTIEEFAAAVREYRAHREAARAAPPPDDRFDGNDRPFMSHAHATAPTDDDDDDGDDGPDLT